MLFFQKIVSTLKPSGLVSPWLLFCFLAVLIVFSSGAFAENFSARDYRDAETQQLQAFFDRFSIRCGGNLLLASGVEFDASSKIVFALTERNLATTADKLNDPGYWATSKYSLYVQGQAIRYLPVASVDLSLGSGSDWKDVEQGFANGKVLPERRQHVGYAEYREYEDSFSLKSLSFDISYESLSTPTAQFGELSDALEYVATHRELPWQKMSCKAFGSYDTAIASFFLLENGDHSFLDKLTDTQTYSASPKAVIDYAGSRQGTAMRAYKQWLYAKLKDVGALGAGEQLTRPNAASSKVPSNGERWVHNGSIVDVLVKPSGRGDGVESFEIRYAAPKASLINEGVNSGTLLFNGTREGKNLVGTIRVFNKKCGSLEYVASGVQSSQSEIDLKARRPVRSNCIVTDRFVDEDLVFQRN